MAFRWTKQRTLAVTQLAAGRTQKQAAKFAGCSLSSVQKWLKDPDFAEELDRLSLMTGEATRAYRLRLAKRAIAQMVDEEKGTVLTEKDVLDWLKYAQSETDGAKLDLASLLESLG